MKNAKEIAAAINSLLVSQACRMSSRNEGRSEDAEFWFRQEIRAENELRELGIPMHGTLDPEPLP